MGEANKKKAPVPDKKKVLIVDDEPAVRQLVQRILSTDFAVIEARDGAEALTMTHSHKLDIILMDMMMPRVDGLTACYAIKTNQATKAIPVVMITAVGYDLNKKLSQDIMGADGYLTKPFSAEELRRTIDQFLAKPEPGKAVTQK
jgi:two-component system alkaline phosphatase synthesis response regulator PhoP